MSVFDRLVQAVKGIGSEIFFTLDMGITTLQSLVHDKAAEQEYVKRLSWLMREPIVVIEPAYRALCQREFRGTLFAPESMLFDDLWEGLCENTDWPLVQRFRALVEREKRTGERARDD